MDTTVPILNHQKTYAKALIRRVWWLIPLIVHDVFLLAATYFPLMNQPDRQDRAGFFWFQWDSLRYILTGTLGYTHLLGITKLKNVAFFPFVPLLVRCFGPWGVLVIEQFTFAVILVLLRSFSKRMGLTPSQAMKTVWLFALCPAAIFYTSVYAEPWTMFGVLTSLYFADKKRWVLAGLAGALTSMTQGTGILCGILPLALFVYSLLRRAWRDVAGSMIWGIGCTLGLAVYMVYLGITFHDPLLFSSVQSRLWHSYWQAPWSQFIACIRVGLVSHNYLRLLYEVIALIYVLGTVLTLMIRKSRMNSWELMGSKIYAAAGLLISISFYPGGAPFSSAIRIVSIYFPIYVGLADRLPKWMYWLVLIAFMGVAYLGASRYSHGYFFQ